MGRFEEIKDRHSEGVLILYDVYSDVEWMIKEIERLRRQNEQRKEKF